LTAERKIPICEAENKTVLIFGLFFPYYPFFTKTVSLCQDLSVLINAQFFIFKEKRGLIKLRKIKKSCS